jgi:hypothetical protein
MTTLGEKLREALDKGTLDAWDRHEEQIRKPHKEEQVSNPKVRVINNVMRTTFDEVKYAPNMQINDYIESLMARGFKKSSVTSVLYQLLRVGQIKRAEDGSVSVTQAEYAPLNNKRAKRKPEPRRKIVVVTRGKPKTAQGIAALKADTGMKAEVELLIPPSAPIQRAFIPSAIVDQLTVLHARELYDYLKKIFGG